MSDDILPTETVHASCVAIDGRGVLLAGRSGSGKSDLALRLMDRGARLVSDDYTRVRRVDSTLLGSPPETIAGRIEVRGLGIVDVDHLAESPIALMVMLDEQVERMPAETPAIRTVAGVALPIVALPAFDASAPIKIELALRAFGLTS